MRARLTTATALAVAAALTLAGCSAGGGDDGGDDTSLTIWTIEDIADRVTVQEEMMTAYAEEAGIEIELVAVAEDQLTTVLTS
ncbi:hypothetical protein NQ234_25670, partial [Escherichia coli]|nr:hypothetical protein [Escherichia coli]